MSHTPAGMILALGVLASVPPPSFAQDDDRERPVMERFLSVLERSPRRGTALDRVYGFHVERGELDRLIQAYRDRTAKDAKDGGSWLLLGLLESQRGRDAAAVIAFREAEACRPDDALPSYYLGQALVLVGQPDAAAEAFERAIARKPARTDLLEIFQALGRVHQRARRDEQALAVWSRLEAIFPDDPRVQEQIASSLAEEARLEPALARYEAMAASTRDPFRRVRFRLEAADLKVKLGRQADALRDYETLLAGLEPESWLFREVRRKVEDTFNRVDDQAGLAKYYESWLAKSPEDVDAMARLGKTLASQGRAAEARVWLDKALKLSPSSKGLRLALVEQLVQEKKFAEAASQYEAMAKLEPNNPDVVRDWGRMLLRDASKPEAERKGAAVAAWRRLVDARPDDPSIAAQVAELCRQAGLEAEAIALYRKAIELAPTAPQYREYLGEYYHQLKRPADALATWRGIAEGPGRTAAALERLGEVLANFGYKAEAVDALNRAIQLDPGSYALRLRQAALLGDARRFDDAEAQLAAAEPLAEDAERREEVLGKRIALDEASGRLLERVEACQKEVEGPKAGDPAAWHRLARYAEAARRPIEATRAAEKAVALDGNSVASRATLARLYEATGRFGEAADVARALATLDRRARVEHFTDVARLEARLGRKDEALKAGREVLAAAPGNPESLQFFADLCYQLGEGDEGLNALRRASRANESDVPTLTHLAEALAREFRTEEAIEVFWKAFERSTDLDVRVGQVGRLADLYLRRNQFDRLVARLERLQAEDGRRREGTFFLAQAYATLGDFGNARHQLEGLLEANARDTGLLKQLSKLSEDEGDISSALKFQQRLCEVAPNRESERRLAQLAVRAGDFDAAEAIWSKTSDTGQDLAAVMSALWNLAADARFEAVLRTTNRLLRADPGNWEALYREGRTLESLGRRDEASARFRALLDLRVDDDEPCASVKALRKNPGRSGVPTPANDGAGITWRTDLGQSTAQYVAGLTPGYSGTRVNAWYPRDFAQARIAALAHELARARRAGLEDQWLADRKQAKERRPTDPRRAWDDLYVACLLSDPKQIYEATRDLVRAVGHESNADFVFLNNLAYRTNAPGSIRAARVIDDNNPDRTPPLPPDEVDLVRDSLRSLLRAGKSLLMVGLTLEGAILELRRANRHGEIDADYRALVDSANDHDAVSIAGYLAAERGDVNALCKLSDAFYRLPTGTRSTPLSVIQTFTVVTPQGSTAYLPSYHMARGMKAMADSKRYGDILRLVDFELAAIESPARAARRAKASQSATPSVPLRNTYPVFTTNRNMVQTVDYPTPTRYLEAGSILLLRGAFTFLKRDNRAGELVEHLKALADASAKDPAAERDARLALSAVLWWNEGRDQSVRELARAVELTPGDVELKLLTAEMRANKRDFDEALAVVDSIEAVDQDATRRRELMALRLAVQTGRPERARQAAERLFGLRLDSATQVQLAAQMHQLGMHDLADAVLARARRQVGNNEAGMIELMAEYRRQGDLDAASQIALDLIRRSTGQTLRLGAIETPAQRQAVEVLASSGKLKEMTERVESQVKASPRSLALWQTLAAYYRAAGRPDKVKEANEAILKLRPEDTALRVQLANQLAQSGDFASAIEHYRAVFEHDPSLLSTYSTSIFATFQQANRLEDLVKLVEAVGLKTLNDPISVRNLVTSLVKDPKTIDVGVRLLKEALEAYPGERRNLLNTLGPIDALWARPEAYELARGGCIPAPKAPLPDPWAGLGEVVVGTFGQDGRVYTLATRLLDAASRDGKLDDLAATTEAANAQQPGWKAGRALLAAIRLRQGRVDEGRIALEKVLADPDSTPAFSALIVLGQEVRDVPTFGPLAIELYERASRNSLAASVASFYLRHSPAWNLSVLHRKAGRLDEALRIARQAEDNGRSAVTAISGGSAVLAAYRLVNTQSNQGSFYLAIGDHADAVRLFDELLGLPDEIQLAKGYDTRGAYPSVDGLVEAAREGLDRSLGGLTRETLPLALEMLIKPGDPSRPVNLAVVVEPREVDRTSIRSLLAAALELASRDPATLAKVKADLDSIVQARPNDLEARTAVALIAGLGGEPGAVASALDRLADESPLPPVAPGGRPDPKARDEAMRRLGLWLVARRCWEHPPSAEVGDRLASKALDAARRLADPSWAMAMLREQGRRSLDRGDRPGAEARFASLLALIQQDAFAPAISPAPPADRANRPAAANARARVPSYTLRRFRQAAEFAALAAESGMADLSLRAIRDALKGGPPVVPVTLTTTPQPVLRTTAAGAPADPPPDPAYSLVEAKLVEIDALWTRVKLDPVAAYEALRDVAFPAARPSEIFLYDPDPTRARRSSAEAQNRPGEVARLLARRAKAAGRLDELRRKVDERKEFPLARVSARWLLAAIEEIR